MHFIHAGSVRAIEKDCYHDTTNDVALRKVVENWLPRTNKEKRTWQTLLNVAGKLGDHELSGYLEKNNILSKQIFSYVL